MRQYTAGSCDRLHSAADECEVAVCGGGLRAQLPQLRRCLRELLHHLVKQPVGGILLLLLIGVLAMRSSNTRRWRLPPRGAAMRASLLKHACCQGWWSACWVPGLTATNWVQVPGCAFTHSNRAERAAITRHTP
jgi:hypothetical protein